MEHTKTQTKPDSRTFLKAQIKCIKYQYRELQKETYSAVSEAGVVLSEGLESRKGKVC